MLSCAEPLALLATTDEDLDRSQEQRERDDFADLLLALWIGLFDHAVATADRPIFAVAASARPALERVALARLERLTTR